MLGQPHAVEVKSADLRGALAHLVLLVAARDAIGSEIDDEDAHAAPPRLRVGAGEHIGEIGDRRVMNPYLAAGQQPA